MQNRIVSNNVVEDTEAQSIMSPDEQVDDVKGKRPERLSEFTGQKNLKNNLDIFIQSANQRNDSLDHVIFHGAPGLGKTTLAHIISRELGVGFRSTVGPLLNKTGDLAAILTNLNERDVLFIDEIHRLKTNIEELLYPAIEDFYLDLIIGEGPAARTMRIDVPKFTLIGATTRLGLLTGALRDRFGISLQLEFYSPDELKDILVLAAKRLKIKMTESAAYEIAKCSRGTPRIALRLINRIRDIALIKKIPCVDESIIKNILSDLDVDNMGLDKLTRQYVTFIGLNYGDRAVGIGTIAAALGEEEGNLEEVIEPYLIQIGFIQRTARGRMLTKRALDYLRLNNINV